jgi:peptide/nickel transport system substrate-binding protein
MIAGLLLAALAFAGCGKVKKPSGDHPGGVDWVSLQKRAESFVPSIGRTGGKIVLSCHADPTSFNPIASPDPATAEFTSFMYEGLVRISGVTGALEPGLAQSWEVSADTLTWTFHVRKGVVWSDSVPLSAYDVAFTFNDLIFDPRNSADSTGGIFAVDGKKPLVTALDSYTVRCVLPRPYAPFPASMSQQILPKHAYERYVKRGVFRSALGVKARCDSMVGTGPFLLSSYQPSRQLVFTRNPRYRHTDSAGNRLPYLDSIVYLIVEDRSTALSEFRDGELDYLAAVGEEYPSLLDGRQRSGYTVHRVGPGTGSTFLAFNQNAGTDPASGRPYVDSVKQSWFRNVLFRKAVAFALDKDDMIAHALNGFGCPQWSPMAPAEGIFFTDSVPRYPYNLDSARALLASAGFRDRNGDKIVEDSAGHPVDFSFVTNGGNSVRGKIAGIIRRNLEALGFTVRFQPLDFDYVAAAVATPPYEWDAVLLGLEGGREPHFAANVWLSSGDRHLWFPSQKAPSTPWEAQIDSLYRIGARETDLGKRRSIYARWQWIAADKLPLIYTVLPERILCIKDKFGNVNPSTVGGLLHDIELIYLKAPAGGQPADSTGDGRLLP